MRGSCNELENPIGIETWSMRPSRQPHPRCNELENPIGIETEGLALAVYSFQLRCNELENPIGIETFFIPDIVLKF